jgi:surface antigen
MTKKKTLLIPIVIIITMVISLITPLSACASTDSDYEPRLTAPNSSIAYYSSKLNYYFQCGYGMPNCTAYAYGRIYELTGEAPLITHGSARDWYSMNIKGGYYEYGSEPKLGAIACWEHHVAIVEAIGDDGSVTVSESQWRGKYFNVKTYPNAQMLCNQKFYGFIYAYTPDEQEEESNTQYKQEKNVSPDNVSQFNLIKLENQDKKLTEKELFLARLL